MHLASGDIPVVRSNLPEGTEASVDATVAKMMEMARGQYGARSVKIRALVLNILNAAGAGDKDYFAYAEAIHLWVRDQIRYVHDPVGQETLSYPEETAFNSKAGDCDDKTILEIAMLGSVGLRAWPVVIGTQQPGAYSHVYLRLQLPPGKGRHAGKIIPADPIMREWPLGKEAPADRVKAHKEYPNLAGLSMLNGYAEGPAYINEADTVQSEKARRAALKAEIGNDPWAVNGRIYDGADSMFAQRPATVMDLSRRGPSVQAAAQETHRRLNTAGVSRTVSDVRPEVSARGPAEVQSANAPSKNGVKGLSGLSGKEEVHQIQQAKAELVGQVKQREQAFQAKANDVRQEAQQGSPAAAAALSRMESEERAWRQGILAKLKHLDAQIAAICNDPRRAEADQAAAAADRRALQARAASDKKAQGIVGKSNDELRADLARADNILRRFKGTSSEGNDTWQIAEKAIPAIKAELIRRDQSVKGLGSDSIVPTDSPKDDVHAPPVFRRRDIQAGSTSTF